jgi:hypothetical protein
MALVSMFLCNQPYASHGRDFLLGAMILNFNGYCVRRLTCRSAFILRLWLVWLVSILSLHNWKPFNKKFLEIFSRIASLTRSECLFCRWLLLLQGWPLLDQKLTGGPPPRACIRRYTGFLVTPVSACRRWKGKRWPHIRGDTQNGDSQKHSSSRLRTGDFTTKKKLLLRSLIQKIENN